MIEPIIRRWQTRLEEWKQFGCQVDGAVLIEQFLADLERIRCHQGDELLSLAEAAEGSGYSEDHLARLVRNGTIANADRKGAPRIKRSDLRMPTTSAIRKLETDLALDGTNT